MAITKTFWSARRLSIATNWASTSVSQRTLLWKAGEIMSRNFATKMGYTKVGPGDAPSFYTDADLDAAMYVSALLASSKVEFSCQIHPVQW